MDFSDGILEKAIGHIVKEEAHVVSPSYFQRKLKIGYPRAARLCDELKDLEIIGEREGAYLPYSVNMTMAIASQ